MSVLTLLVFAGLILALSFTFSLRRRPEPFDPGSFPIGSPPVPKTHEAEPTPKASTLRLTESLQRRTFGDASARERLRIPFIEN
ncbi:MAG TPA: hypothetical protein VMN76_10415 [Acidobacteriota bacterium]|nr:hypothetical protein [Acidobacteriota bacterium]